MMDGAVSIILPHQHHRHTSLRKDSVPVFIFFNKVHMEWPRYIPYSNDMGHGQEFYLTNANMFVDVSKPCKCVCTFQQL